MPPPLLTSPAPFPAAVVALFLPCAAAALPWPCHVHARRAHPCAPAEFVALARTRLRRLHSCVTPSRRSWRPEPRGAPTRLAQPRRTTTSRTRACSALHGHRPALADPAPRFWLSRPPRTRTPEPRRLEPSPLLVSPWPKPCLACRCRTRAALVLPPLDLAAPQARFPQRLRA
ncbi:hypothetical protein PVAP13_4KG222805 [Panicum virgatum]|uniref:Secreted protein n=1 Tax=Panicum virgatum TaxID=38727 RepID=A0A8T0TGL3_PANVG|nr:hypothetical protein PVAP13_4KG222805 [Panicum virgatum]